MAIDYKARHEAAIASTTVSTAARDMHEAAIVGMMKGLAMYAAAHEKRFKSKIGEDYVLGPQFAAIGEALIALLNGEMGRLDGGSMDRALRALLAANECEIEQ